MIRKTVLIIAAWLLLSGVALAHHSREYIELEGYSSAQKGQKANFVYATDVGFSDEKDTFCYATKPDKEGVAKIKILKKGIWIIYAPDELPYPRPEEADIYSFISSLTFEIK